MKAGIAIAVFLLAAVSAAQEREISAEDAFAAVFDLVDVERESWYAEQLQLTDQEQIEFWPIYDDYMGALATVDDRMIELLIGFADTWDQLSGDDARDLVDEYFDIETERLSIRRRYLRRFDDVLPPKKLARFVQLENKFDVLVNLEFAEAVPLIR